MCGADGQWYSGHDWDYRSQGTCLFWNEGTGGYGAPQPCLAPDPFTTSIDCSNGGCNGILNPPQTNPANYYGGEGGHSGVGTNSGVASAVLGGTAAANDVLFETLGRNVDSALVRNLVPLPAKAALAGPEALIKFNELKSLGFSDNAALVGALRAQEAGKGMQLMGAGAGMIIGIALTSPTVAGTVGGAAAGNIVGGLAGGAVDWMFGVSDSAALKAARAYDGN